MNKPYSFPYGKTTQTASLPETCIQAVIESDLSSYRPPLGPEETVKYALANPHDTTELSVLAKGCKTVTVITSDHTRPMPSQITMPLLLQEIRKGNPDAQITILIATGCHRKTTQKELTERFGETIVKQEHIVVHNCDEGPFCQIGTSPSGNHIELNQIACEADLLIAEGFIEPHFFAGFSGGRKSILPGVASRKTLMYNHAACNIHDPHSISGILEGNPVHEDMLFAAKASGIRFILNVILNQNKEIIGAVAGDIDTAHKAGVAFLSSMCRRKPVFSDIVITSNGGYPLDQNIYHSVKGMTTAAASCKKGGVIIMLSSCCDGHGGQDFFQTFAREQDTKKILDGILSRAQTETIPDQWQSQIFCQILLDHTVILVSDAPREMIEALHLIYSNSLSDAFCQAIEILHKPEPSITLIPDGVSVILS